MTCIEVSQAHLSVCRRQHFRQCWLEMCLEQEGCEESSVYILKTLQHITHSFIFSHEKHNKVELIPPGPVMYFCKKPSLLLQSFSELLHCYLKLSLPRDAYTSVLVKITFSFPAGWLPEAHNPILQSSLPAQSHKGFCVQVPAMRAGYQVSVSAVASIRLSPPPS